MHFELTQFNREYEESLIKIEQQLAPFVEAFHNRLRKVASLTFPATEEGYSESFLLAYEIQNWAKAIRRILAVDGQPVFIVRLLPPFAIKGDVGFSLRDWQKGNEMGECQSTVGELTSIPINAQIATGFGSLELERQESIEKLRRYLVELEGYESKGRQSALEIKGSVNSRRKTINVSFELESNGQSEKVSLGVSHTSFCLLRSWDNKTLHTSKYFPKIVIVDNFLHRPM